MISATDQRRPNKSAYSRKLDTEGFIMRPMWWFRTDLKPTAREVLTVLHSYLPYGRDTGVVFPCVKTIAAEANIGKTAAYEALHALEDAGLITWTKRDGDKNHNEYVIHALSRQQIEALCRRKEPAQRFAECAESACPTVAERSESERSSIRNPVIERSESGHEGEQGKRARERDQNLGLAVRAELGRGVAETQEKDPGEPGQVAGPGPNPGSAGPNQGPTGPGSNPATGPGPGPDSPGSTAIFPAANTEKTWTSKVNSESKGERYKRPLDDPEMERRCLDLAQFTMDRFDLPESKREATMVSARYLLDHDGHSHREVMLAVSRVCANGSRWKYIRNLYMVRENYADIVRDIESGKPAVAPTTKRAWEQANRKAVEEKAARPPRPPGVREIEL